MSYGSNIRDQYRRAADFVDKILRGTKPADIPVEQPTKFEKGDFNNSDCFCDWC
jgi:putative ABC transport system substrate-binding protein